MPKKLSSEEAAFMRGFGIAISGMAEFYADRAGEIAQSNGFKFSDFKGLDLEEADLKRIKNAFSCAPGRHSRWT